jgi:proton glutamate symport protein
MTPDSPAPQELPRRGLRRISATQWFIVAMVAGALFGCLWPAEAKQLKFVSDIFLRLIKCIVVPLIFSTLVVGIAGHSDDLKAVGRLALKSIIYFEVVTTLALVVGLVTVNLLQPGAGVKLPVASDKSTEAAAGQLSVSNLLEHSIPQSVFESAARNDVLAVVVFAVIFGIALSQVQGKPRETMLGFFEGLSEVMFKFTALVMKLAPFGIAAAMAVAVGHAGLDVLQSLGKVVATLYAAVLIFVLVVLLPIALIARVSLRRFWNLLKQPTLIAFSTTSSEAALPSAMEQLVKFGVPKRIVSFVLPAGYSFNLDGTTLYLAVATPFVAQAAGVSLTIGQQITAMLIMMLTSKGAAGVPRAGIVVLSATLTTMGLPLEGVALLLSVDLLMDMARTTLNLIGNCLAGAVVARWEGELKSPPNLPAA